MNDKESLQPSASQRHRAREAVVQALYQWELSGYSMTQVAAAFRADNNLKRADVVFFHDALTAINQKHEELVKVYEATKKNIEESTKKQKDIKDEEEKDDMEKKIDALKQK